MYDLIESPAYFEKGASSINKYKETIGACSRDQRCKWYIDIGGGIVMPHL